LAPGGVLARPRHLTIGGKPLVTMGRFGEGGRFLRGPGAAVRDGAGGPRETVSGGRREARDGGILGREIDIFWGGRGERARPDR
jgi:hypothetical protein